MNRVNSRVNPFKSVEDYFLILFADDQTQVNESNENNNTVVSNSTFTIEADDQNCTGFFIANSQAELNDFNPNCTTWNGSITLSGNITDLSPLSNLDVITGVLQFEEVVISSLSQLSGLQQVGSFFLFNNNFLVSLEGAENVLVTDAIQVIGNNNLDDLDNMPNPSGSLNNFTVANNISMDNIFGAAVFNGNFPNLTLVVDQNPVLTSLDGLQNITGLQTISIANNPFLEDCCAIFELLESGNFNTANIANNLSCNSVQDVLDACDDGGNTGGADVALFSSSASDQVNIFGFVTVSLTVINEGTMPLTGVVVDVPLPDGVTFEGGNEFAATKGNYSPYGNRQWTVGNLGVGQSATLEVNYFVLSSNTIVVYGEVIALNEIDIDSTPNNGTPPSTNEDDETLKAFPVSSSVQIAMEGNFQVMKNKQTVDVFWANEIGTSTTMFEVERSFDGNHFEPIFTAEGNAGNTAKLYKRNDANPTIGANFYRLKTHRDDGTVEVSAVQSVLFEDLATFILFPNPAKDFVNIYLKGFAGDMTLRVVNLQGQELKMVQLDGYESPVYQLDVSDLRSGQYFVWMLAEGRRSVTQQLMLGK